MKSKILTLSILGALTCESYPIINSKLFPPDPFSGVHDVMERCENAEVICYLMYYQADVKTSCFPKNHPLEIRSKIESSEKLAKKWAK